MGQKAHVIVVGNEKGGSGKSTVAMHVAIGLVRLGYKVGTVDLDSHQATFTSYMKNRFEYARSNNIDLPMPEHVHVDRAMDSDTIRRREEEEKRVNAVIAELSAKNDFVVVDTPGSDRFISLVGHGHADTLITPMNDSYVDLDLLAKIDPKTHAIVMPSVYTEMVWELRRQKKLRGEKPMEWFVMRNRLAARDNKNKRDIGNILQGLCFSVGCRLAPGLIERVAYRDLFLQGLTLLDAPEGRRLSVSAINARQEVRSLVQRLLPQVDATALAQTKIS